MGILALRPSVFKRAADDRTKPCDGSTVEQFERVEVLETEFDGVYGSKPLTG